MGLLYYMTDLMGCIASHVIKRGDLQNVAMFGGNKEYVNLIDV